MRANFSPVANFAYQLDCVSDNSIHCSRKNFTKLWEQNFINGDEDRRLLKAWFGLRQRYSTSVELHNDNSAAGEYFDGLDISTKFRLVGLQSETLHDYMQRLDLVLTPKDKTIAATVINRFYPKFMKWWDSEAASSGSEFAKGVEKLLSRNDLKEKIEQFYRFYDTELPDNAYSGQSGQRSYSCRLVFSLMPVSA